MSNEEQNTDKAYLYHKLSMFMKEEFLIRLGNECAKQDMNNLHIVIAYLISRIINNTALEDEYLEDKIQSIMSCAGPISQSMHLGDILKSFNDRSTHKGIVNKISNIFNANDLNAIDATADRISDEVDKFNQEYHERKEKESDKNKPKNDIDSFINSVMKNTRKRLE